MDTNELKKILECLIFVAPSPVTLDELKGIIEGVDKDQLSTAIEELISEFNLLNRSFYIAQVSKGYQFRTREEYAPWVRAYLKAKPLKLTKPALETLAIIAYKQPVTRAEIESIRGVDTGGVLKNLLERRLIRIMGRMEVPGRPLVYGTTTEFLELFGLKDIKDLPTLKDYEDLARELKENKLNTESELDTNSPMNLQEGKKDKEESNEEPGED